MKFSWDDQKEKINISKHGIDFNTATLVFGDTQRLEYLDEKHSTLEEYRYITIGMIKTVVIVLVVVYTVRDDTIRIISARIATKREEARYYVD